MGSILQDALHKSDEPIPPPILYTLLCTYIAGQVLHALLGVVRSPWLTTLMQVSSRIVLVWGFFWAVPSTQGQIGAMMCITSWACVEIPRCDSPRRVRIAPECHIREKYPRPLSCSVASDRVSLSSWGIIVLLGSCDRCRSRYRVKNRQFFLLSLSSVSLFLLRRLCDIYTRGEG